jgi:hypothetical protein
MLSSPLAKKKSKDRHSVLKGLGIVDISRVAKRASAGSLAGIYAAENK